MNCPRNGLSTPWVRTTTQASATVHSSSPCYRRALEVADERGARSVAFPLIRQPAGVYGWPHADAVSAAVDTLAETPTRVEDVRLVAFGDSLFLRMRARVLPGFPAHDAGCESEPCSIEMSAQWGFRGDPCLWRELRARFADTRLPAEWFTLARS